MNTTDMSDTHLRVVTLQRKRADEAVETQFGKAVPAWLQTASIVSVHILHVKWEVWNKLREYT